MGERVALAHLAAGTGRFTRAEYALNTFSKIILQKISRYYQQNKINLRKFRPFTGGE
jgi:hypothetical protein